MSDFTENPDIRPLRQQDYAKNYHDEFHESGGAW